MKYILLLVALATLSLRSCLCDNAISELEKFYQAAQQQGTSKEAVEQSSSEQDEEEVAQELDSLLADEQGYTDIQDQDITDMQDFSEQDLQVGIHEVFYHGNSIVL